MQFYERTYDRMNVVYSLTLSPCPIKRHFCHCAKCILVSIECSEPIHKFRKAFAFTVYYQSSSVAM